MKHYIGLDAHSATCTFVCLDHRGMETRKTKVQTSEKNIVDFLSSLNGEKYLVFEEQGLAKWMHAITFEKVNQVTVCHPGYISRRPGQKDDYKDALHLAHELRKGHLVSVFHDAENFYIPLRVLASSYLDIVKDLVSSKNRLKAVFRTQGILKKGSIVYTDDSAVDEIKSKPHQFSAKALLEQIKNLEQIKQSYIKEFKENMKKYEILKLLDTIPQIDAVRANILAAYICDGNRFENKHKFWAYIGLVRYMKMSDDKSYGSRKIHGRSELKSIFISASEGILSGETTLKKYYDSLRSKGLDHYAARKAVARRLAAIVLTIFKTSKPYDDKFEEKKKRDLKKTKT